MAVRQTTIKIQLEWTSDIQTYFRDVKMDPKAVKIKTNYNVLLKYNKDEHLTSRHTFKMPRWTPQLVGQTSIKIQLECTSWHQDILSRWQDEPSS